MTRLSGHSMVRAPRIADVPAIAHVHVEGWRQTYRGLMSDEILDDPTFHGRRERMWQAILADPQYADRSVAVAEVDERIVGVAMAGPPSDEDATWERQLYVLYLLDDHHGSGAGIDLMSAAIPEAASAALWVADPNPRAQAFYRKVGFLPDGATKDEDGVREVRMTRRSS